MPLRLAVNDDGHTGEALRRHRGPHLLLGTSQCRRLSKLIPSKVQDNGTAAEIAFATADWLASTIVVFNDAAKALPIYRFVLGQARMGVALDRALSHIKDDMPRACSVLRAQLHKAAEADRKKNGDVDSYMVLDTDMYQVAAAFPTGSTVDDVYDWFKHLTFGSLQTADRTNAVYGALAQSIGVRFLPTALDAGGPISRFAQAVEASVDTEEATIYATLEAKELAAEFAAWLTRVYPLPHDPLRVPVTRGFPLVARRGAEDERQRVVQAHVHDRVGRGPLRASQLSRPLRPHWPHGATV